VSEVVCVGIRSKKKRLMIVRQDLLGEKKSCPNCHLVDGVYVHLEHKDSDPINPKYLCIGCHHEWDDESERLNGHHD
jgi:hypothetical protein